MPSMEMSADVIGSASDAPSSSLIIDRQRARISGMLPYQQVAIDCPQPANNRARSSVRVDNGVTVADWSMQGLCAGMLRCKEPDGQSRRPIVRFVQSFEAGIVVDFCLCASDEVTCRT